jgi:predicted PurR-regulated permease PerM
MNHQTAHHFFMGLLLAVLVLSILIFLPFLTPLVFAVSLAVIFSPVYRSILRTIFPKKDKSTTAAFITLVIVAVIVIIPAFFVFTKMYAEVQDMYYFLTEEGSRSTVITALNHLSSIASKAMFNVIPAVDFSSFNITDYMKQGLEWGFGHLDTIFDGAGRILVAIFITFFALFYFLRDGRDLKKQIILLSPLTDTDDEHILKKLEQAVYSIVAGSLVVSVLQGIMTGIGFAIFGIPEPAVWGSIAAIAALVPGGGTSLVLIPGILYLFFTGNTWNAAGLLVWGIVAVSFIDNFLGPIIVNRGIKIHPFLILLSVLGGIAFFGLSGFILGPLVLAFLFALLEIYKTSRSTL